MTRPLIFALTVALAPSLGWAIGFDEDEPPTPTETTTVCKDGQIYDEETESCVDPQSGALDDDTLYDAVREFAYAGQLTHAQTALAAMSNQHDDRVLTYWGFTHRKRGDMATGMAYYEQALARNPNNFLARSYMGQAFVDMGAVDRAEAQLDEIDARGGAGTWAATALATAINTGLTTNY